MEPMKRRKGCEWKGLKERQKGKEDRGSPPPEMEEVPKVPDGDVWKQLKHKQKKETSRLKRRHQRTN